MLYNVYTTRANAARSCFKFYAKFTTGGVWYRGLYIKMLAVHEWCAMTSFSLIAPSNISRVNKLACVGAD